MSTFYAAAALRGGPRDTDALLRMLGVEERDTEVLVEMFESYIVDTRQIRRTERNLMSAIRHFLRDRKYAIKQHFRGHVLGMSGCFPFAIRSCIIARWYGIECSLAHSTLHRCLHVLVVDSRGRPFDVRELRRGAIVPMSIFKARLYAATVLPVTDVFDTLKRRALARVA